MGCSLKGSTSSFISYWDSFHIYIIYDFSSSGIISTLTSSMISASSPKSGDTSVVVTVWMCCHMPIPIHNSYSVIIVPNAELSSEGECFAGWDRMMEGTPFPPFFAAIFGSRRWNNVFNRSCAFKYSHKGAAAAVAVLAARLSAWAAQRASKDKPWSVYMLTDGGK